MDAGTSNQYTPILYDINIAIYENAPQDVKINIYDKEPVTDGGIISARPPVRLGSQDAPEFGSRAAIAGVHF